MTVISVKDVPITRKETQCCDGWVGDTCTQATCNSGCGPGLCVGPNTCSCDGTGYTGAMCEIRKFGASNILDNYCSNALSNKQTAGGVRVNQFRVPDKDIAELQPHCLQTNHMVYKHKCPQPIEIQLPSTNWNAIATNFNHRNQFQSLQPIIATNSCIGHSNTAVTVILTST